MIQLTKGTFRIFGQILMTKSKRKARAAKKDVKRTEKVILNFMEYS